MKYIIYGANRVAKDFLYMFEELDIICIVDDSWKGKVFLEYNVYGESYIIENRRDERIIVCDFDKRRKIDKLCNWGLVYGKDFCYEEDFFSQLDMVQIPDDRILVMWGTGNIAKWFCENYPYYEFEFYIDSYKKSQNFNNVTVKSPEEIQDWGKYFIIIGVEKDREIKEKLSGFGLAENIDYVGYQSLTGRPSDMLRKTIFDRSYYDLKCNTMLNHLEILHGGDTRCCCTTFVKQNLDNMMNNTIGTVWKSNLHKVLCLSTENRTYSFCDKSMCPLFVGKKSENVNGLERNYQKMNDYPETLALSYDATCNLNCITCRKDIHVAKGKEEEEVLNISKKVKEDYLGNCKFLILAGDGEVFLSNGYKEIYLDKKCNPNFIRLLSNGMLFNRKNWDKFIENKTGVIMLTVSVDAATKETYEKIRRNGNFDILKENMCFAAGLRKSGQLKYFRLNFVVQRENYQEMPLFVRWGEELGVDEVFFTKILNWGTYSEEEFAQISMMEKDGVTPKKELIEVMKDPLMSSDIVDLGTIQYGHKIDEIDGVENYYMWELEKRGGKLFST